MKYFEPVFFLLFLSMFIQTFRYTLRWKWHQNQLFCCTPMEILTLNSWRSGLGSKDDLTLLGNCYDKTIDTETICRGW